MTAQAISERDFQDRVIAEAQLRGWLCAHFRPARTATGWRTAVQGDVGFVDTVLVRPPRVIFAELKTEKGRTSPEQLTWLEGLKGCDGVETYLFRPSDSDLISRVLR